MKVILIRSNPIDPDIRITKEAQTLADAGYNVNILGWDREKKYPEIECRSNYLIHRIKLKAPFGMKIVFYLPIWWIYEFIWLLKERWDIVHASDFDTFIPALIAAKIKKKPIIYDIYDFYADVVTLPKLLRWTTAKIDKIFMKFASAVIIVDKSILKQIGGYINNYIVIIMNTPKDVFKNIKLEKKTENKKDIFTIFYLGGIYKTRYPNLDKIILSIKGMSDVELIIGGYADDNTIHELKKNMENMNNAKFIGKITDEEAIKHTIKADLLFALYDPSGLSNRYLSPNKLFEAMMYAKPILVSENSTMAEIVRENNYGIVVNCRDVKEIKGAIIKLKNDPGLCRQLGENARKAYDEKYNWQIMEQRLLGLYDKLLNC
ncbi:MAG: glycosyltransferase family 4 protein [Methanosarcinales archaeon]|nr:glycosyltransferase family 4 protein [Methanosarcinales archaeon]